MLRQEAQSQRVQGGDSDSPPSFRATFLPLLGQHELCHIGYFRAGAVQELQLVVA